MREIFFNFNHMTSIVLENVPENFAKKMGDKVDFDKIIGLYWDGMDWCQYNEVIPDKSDLLSFDNYEKELSKNNGKDFLSQLLK